MNHFPKNFNPWEKLKKIIDRSKRNNLYFRDRDIFYAHLGLNIGVEQDGKGENFERPVVILKKFNQYCCLIVPLTSQTKTGKYYVPITFQKQGRASTAIISQVRLIDSKRLINKFGVISKSDFQALKKAIRENTLDG